MTATRQAARYCWDELSPDRPMPLLERRRIIGRQAMLSQVLLRKGCVVPMHSHENEQFACVVSGVMRFGIKEGGGERELVLRSGDVLHLPCNVPHSAEAVEDCVILDIFARRARRPASTVSDLRA